MHAGWRGLSLGILPEFINKINHFEEKVSNYYVLIGPSIQSCCFEIGHDVLDRFDPKFYNNISKNKFKWIILIISPLILQNVRKNRLINSKMTS